MGYATKQDMLERFEEEELIQLTDFQRAGVIDDAVLATALNDADERIDSKLRGSYSLPLASTPQELVRIACDLARWFLYRHAPPQHVKDAFDGAMRELRDYASGVSVLDVGTTSDTVGQQQPVTVAPAQVFTNAVLGKIA